MGETPPYTPEPKSENPFASSSRPEAALGNLGGQDSGLRVEVTSPAKTAKAEQELLNWKEKYPPNLLGSMMAEDESDEEAPENIRLMLRINELKISYRDYKLNNKSYGETSESWASYRDGMLRGNGWVQQGSSWHKPGSVPPVKLPTIKPGKVLFPASHLMLPKKSKKGMKATGKPAGKVSSTKAMKVTKALKKPAAANKMKKPAASSSKKKQ